MHGLVGFLNLMSGLCSAGATRPSRAQSALGPSRPSLAAAVTAPTWAPRRSSICSDCQIQSCISSHRDDLRLNRARGRPGHWHVLLFSNYHHHQHLGLEIIGLTGGGGLRVDHRRPPPASGREHETHPLVSDSPQAEPGGYGHGHGWRIAIVTVR